MSKRVEAKAEGMNVQSPRLKVCNSGLIPEISPEGAIYGSSLALYECHLGDRQATASLDARLEQDSIIAANFVPYTERVHRRA